MVYGKTAWPTATGLESMMSPSTKSRSRYKPTPAVLTSLERSPRRKFRRLAFEVASPRFNAACCAEVRLANSKGAPLLPFHVRITRPLVAVVLGGWAVVGPATPVLAQVEPLGTPVSTQEASQLAVVEMVRFPEAS